MNRNNHQAYPLAQAFRGFNSFMKNYWINFSKTENNNSHCCVLELYLITHFYADLLDWCTINEAFYAIKRSLQQGHATQRGETVFSAA